MNLADESLGIAWPIPLDQAELSAKDRSNPRLSEVAPASTRKTLIVGVDGQVGRALREIYSDADDVEFAGRKDLDLNSATLDDVYRWSDFVSIINAAAYTAVDDAETSTGRAKAWAANVAGVAALARICHRYNITLTHISSDYVFDGAANRSYTEADPICPLGVYGQTKAAGDEIVATLPRHYIVRTSWVIGDGRNFVRTMLSLAQKGVSPSVIDDQRGRLTFTSQIARAIRHLIDAQAPYGIYNLTASGPVRSWADIAQKTFELAGSDPNRVTRVSTVTYFERSTHPIAPRPRNSVLDLSKIEATGFTPTDADDGLADYIRTELGAK